MDRTIRFPEIADRRWKMMIAYLKGIPFEEEMNQIIRVHTAEHGTEEEIHKMVRAAMDGESVWTFEASYEGIVARLGDVEATADKVEECYG
jgi:hypothetical protein